jgi:hypothetical protein
VTDLENAFAKLAAVKSYRASLATPKGPAIKTEVVNPDRSRTVMGDMEVIAIGTTTYMKIGGTWQKSTPPPGAKPDAPFSQRYAAGPGAVVHDLGMNTVGGTSLHAYSVQKDASAPLVTVYVGPDGSIAEIDAPDLRGSMVMRFSDFNAPISIVAPV